MSDQKKIPELYKAEDIRREAYELERIAQLRKSAKKLLKLRVLPFILAVLISVMMIGTIYGLSMIFPQSTSASAPHPFVFVAFLSLYIFIVHDLVKPHFEDLRYKEMERLQKLFHNDPLYRDALKRMDEEYPAVAKKIRRMKRVTGEATS